MTGEDEIDDLETGNDEAEPVGSRPPVEPAFDEDEVQAERRGASKADRAAYNKVRGLRGESKPDARTRIGPDEDEDEIDWEADDLIEGGEEEEGGDDDDEEEEAEPEAKKPAKAKDPKAKRNELMRSKVPKDVVDSLTDEQVDAIYAGVSARQADVDRILQENARLRKGTQAPEGAEHATPPALPDLNAAFAEVAESLGGEESLAPLRKALESQQAIIERLQTESLVARRAEQQRVLRDSLNRVGAEFPDLADKKHQKALYGRMKALAKTDEFRDKDLDESIDELTRAAARSLGLRQSDVARPRRDAFKPSDRRADGRKPAVGKAHARAASDREAYRAIRARTRQGLRT